MSRQDHDRTPDAGGAGLYRAGGIAALLAGIVFRRNLGVEVELFHPIQYPVEAGGWFELLQNFRLLGMTYLQVFDVVNYLLVAVMLVGLYVALRRDNPGLATLAAVLGLLGVAAAVATNTAFSMLALSDKYAQASSEAQRAQLTAAGDALLALNRFSSPGAHPGGGYFSLLLVALGSLLFALVMLRSRLFSRAAALVGLVTAGLDLAYCAAFAFLPGVDSSLLSVIFIPAAGLGWMVWHILVGWRLLRLEQAAARATPQPG